jgi:serine protease AprX
MARSIIYRNILLLVLIAVGSASMAVAQKRYVVYFNDKTSTPYKISEPETFLSSKAISRRVKQEIPVTEADLPVDPSYVQQLKAAGIEVHFTSRWLNCALVQTILTEEDLQDFSFVKNVSFVGEVAPAAGRLKSTKTRKQTGGAEATKRQLEMVGIDDMQADNILGEGVLVAVLDAGFEGVNTAEPFQHLFTENKIDYVYDFAHRSNNVYAYDDHGTEVFSVMAANSSSFTGGAYNASYQLYVTEDDGSEYPVEEFNWLFAAERADSCGVDVIQTSLGYNTFDYDKLDYNKTTDLDGNTAIISKAAAAAIARGIVVISSAGNEAGNSWGTITPPADVKGIVSVGSVTSAGARSPFSSTGPSSDGRIKPDVVALGSGVSVVRPNGTNGFASGTSLAAPIVTSLIIGLIQRFPDIDPNTIAEKVIMTASQSNHPDNSFGYGIPDYDRVKASLESMLPLEQISIYPNPTDTGKFSIRFKTPGVQATIIVYDLNGKILSSHTVDVNSSNNPIEINVADLPASSYLVKVKTNDNFKAFRLVKL